MRKQLKLYLTLFLCAMVISAGLLCNQKVDASSDADNVYTYAEYNESYAIRDEDGYTTTYPTDNEAEDTIFAGWYKDEAYSKAVSADDTFEGEGNLYAKFVDKAVLSLVYQVEEGAYSTIDTEDGTWDVRLLTSVDSFKYESVGFYISGIAKTSNTVYNTIVGITDEGENYYHAYDIFSEDSIRFATFTLTDAQNIAAQHDGDEQFGWTFEVQPTWTTIDGTIVKGATYSIELNDEFYEAEVVDTFVREDDGSKSGAEHQWGTFTEAVALANENGQTGSDGETVLINLNGYTTYQDYRTIELDALVEPTVNMQINSPNTAVTIARGKIDTSNNMFKLETANTTLTLGANDAVDGAKLIVDGYTSTAISGRTVLVNLATTTLVLEENATLQRANSSSTGSAICNKGTLVLEGDILNNTSEKRGGAILQAGTGTITINSGNYKSNASTGTTDSNGKGGLIAANNNTSTGTIIINGGTFSENSALRGGVISTIAGQTVTITGGTFTNNTATQIGGVLHLVNNTTTTISGSAKLTGNHTATESSSNMRGGGAIILVGTSSITLDGVDVSRNIAEGEATCDVLFCNDSDAETGTLTLKGYEQFDGVVGWYKTTTNSTATVSIVDSDGNVTNSLSVDSEKSRYVSYLTETPTFVTGVAQFEFNDRGYYFNNLKAAVDYVNNTDGIGGTGEAETVVIDVLDDITLTNTVKAQKNMQIRNLPGKTVTIGRGANDVLMFNTPKVTDTDNNILAQTLILGSNDDATGSLIIDGTYTVDGETSVSSKRIVDVRSTGSTFILGDNTTIQNAHSTQSGAAMVNLGTTTIYGTICNNTSTATGGAGAILQAAGSSELTLEDATCFNNHNTSGSGKGGVIGAQQALCGTVMLHGGDFYNNSAAYGGVVYIKKGQLLTIGRANNNLVLGQYYENQATAGAVIYLDEHFDSSGTGKSTRANISYANFYDNTTTSVESVDSVAGGGVIYMLGTTSVTFRGATFSGNTVENGSGCDIVFDLTETDSGLLQLKSYTTFPGIIGWYGTTQTDTDECVANVKFFDAATDDAFEEIASLEYGKSYTVDYTGDTPVLVEVTE